MPDAAILPPNDLAHRTLGRIEAARPDVVGLATLAALARKIEPELLRALRLELGDRLPVKSRPHAGTEAALWFSALVESRGPDSITLLPAVSRQLQDRLKADGELFKESYKIIEECHTAIAPVLQWEEKLVYVALRGDLTENERELRIRDAARQALEAISTNTRIGLEERVREMWLRLPAAAATNPYLSNVHRECDIRALKRAGLKAPVEGPSLATILLRVERIGRALRVGHLEQGGRVAIRVPAFDPVILEELENYRSPGAIRKLEIRAEHWVDVPFENRPVVLRTIDGSVYSLTPDLFGEPSAVAGRASDWTPRLHWASSHGGGYLPFPIEHDVFFSYAHEDRPWVTALQEQLTEHLLQRLGFECNVWQDEKNLRTAQNIPEELDKAIHASAAFIAVLSRSYQNSKWCEKELAAFLQESRKVDALETGGYGRVLKVIRFPWADSAHEDFLPDYKAVPFFDRDKTGHEREFRHTSAAFRKAVDELSFHIEKLFEAMLAGFEKIFVARAAEDASEEREALIREIRAAGYALSPPLGAIPIGLDRKRLLKFIDESRISVHPLGATFDEHVREQIDLALEVGRKTVFYLTRGHETATGEQKTLIEDLRRNAWNLPAGSWTLLASRSPAVQRQDLIDLLRPPRPTPASSRNAIVRVYILCDHTSEDAGFGRELQGKIREKENFEVALLAAEASSRRSEHERLLGSCDGLLLYHQSAPAAWFRRNLMDLVTAEDRPRARQLTSKALLVGGSNVEIPGLMVIQRHDDFEYKHLEPFLGPLRAIPGDQGGAANVAL